MKTLRHEKMDPVQREAAEETPDILLKESRERLEQEYRELKERVLDFFVKLMPLYDYFNQFKV